MGFGPFSSDSNTSQSTTNVSGSGQLNKGSTIAQGGSVLVGKGAQVGGYQLKGVKGNVSVTNNGLQADQFQSIVGDLIKATPAQQQQAAPVVVTSPAAAAPSTDTKTDYMKYLPLLIGALAFGFAARLIFKK